MRQHSIGLVLLFTTLLICSGTLSASWRKPVKAKHGMVVSAESLATQAGVEMLRRGGNAVDAAVAVAFTLAVTFPEAGNIGGGGFMLIRRADGRSTMIDFRETAPSHASRTMYLDGAGAVVPNKSLLGSLAAGVPGSVAGYLYALEKYGTLPRQQVIAPAVDAAELGFRLSERVAEGFKQSLKDFKRFPSTVAAITKDGVPYSEGELFRQRDLAATLKSISANGRDGFYKGDVAAKIIAEMERSGGIISLTDLASYEVVEREPLFGSYRGYGILTASPPSAGGVVLLQILNTLERFDLAGKGHNSSQAVHLFAAAAQWAFSDRSVYLGDPDFVDIPLQRLISKDFAMLRAARIDSTRSRASTTVQPASADELDPHQTTHICVADAFGNVVALTTTLNDFYGCKVVVGGAGFFLNNEMDDFSIKPGMPNIYGLTGGDANAIAPRKRMLSSMTPTIVLKGRRPFLIVGGRGGSKIPTAVASIISNVIDFGLNIQDAVELPRIHHQWLPDKIYYETNGLQPDVQENLKRMGYTLEQTATFNARAHALLIDHQAGLFFGAPDPREEGVAIGY